MTWLAAIGDVEKYAVVEGFTVSELEPMTEVIDVALMAGGVNDVS